jgi:hypothetical protein
MLVENRNVQASRHIECDRLGRRHAHGLRACVIFQVFVGGACAGVETPAHLFVIPGLGQAEVLDSQVSRAKPGAPGYLSGTGTRGQGTESCWTPVLAVRVVAAYLETTTILYGEPILTSEPAPQ